MLLDVLFRIGIVFGLTVGAYGLTRRLLARIALPLLHRNRPTWAVHVERSRLPMLTALLVAALVLGFGVGVLVDKYAQLANLLQLVNTAVGISILCLMLTTSASIGLAIYEQTPLSKEVPLTGLVQLVQGGIFLIGFLIIVTSFLGVPALYSFAALAAIFTALGFVFQEPIMGFVAGIQLAANKMVAIGDWIEVPQFGGNGTVQQISMASVKIRNWDNTTTTIPTRSMISDSFKNWRSMVAVGGRRLQRSVLLDIHSVRPLTPALSAQFPILAGVWQQISTVKLVAGDILVGDAIEQPTNLGVYRVYLTDYLRRHPRVNQEMLCMVRQLQIVEDGLPLELYAFLLDTGWPSFETAASSIFEHVYSTMPQFGLRPFQRPLSTDSGDPPTNAPS